MNQILSMHAGGFGDVFCGKLRNLTGESVDVAIKSLKKCDDEKERKNFEREMSVSADPSMFHPNIVRVYGIVQKGTFYNYSYIYSCI